jgi:hypothetical protein
MKKKIWPNFPRIIEVFTQKIVTKPSKIWVWDPGSEIRDPGVKKSPAPGSGIRIRNTVFGVKILKFFDEDPGSGMETVRFRDPGWKKVGSGIRGKHPGSATLQ